MIDVSNFKKIGEYRNGSMNWLSSQKHNIVYLITFGDDTYIGSTENIRRRFSQYIPAFKKGEYEVDKVQSAFDTHRCFDVYIIDCVDKVSLRKMEDIYISNLHPSLNTRLYDHNSIGDRIKLKIKEVAAEHGMLLKDVCEKAGYKSLPSFYRQINNPESVNMRTLIRIAEVIGCEVQDFFTGGSQIEQPHIVCPKCGEVIPIETTVKETT